MLMSHISALHQIQLLIIAFLILQSIRKQHKLAGHSSIVLDKLLPTTEWLNLTNVTHVHYKLTCLQFNARFLKLELS